MQQRDEGSEIKYIQLFTTCVHASFPCLNLASLMLLSLNCWRTGATTGQTSAWGSIFLFFLTRPTTKSRVLFFTPSHLFNLYSTTKPPTPLPPPLPTQRRHPPGGHLRDVAGVQDAAGGEGVGGGGGALAFARVWSCERVGSRGGRWGEVREMESQKSEVTFQSN